MQPPQIDVGGNGPGLQHAQQHFGPRFNDDSWLQWSQCPVPDHPQPAFAAGSRFGAGQCINVVLTGARGNAVVGAGEKGFGDLQIEHRLTFGLVFGSDDLARLVLAAGAQAGAFAGVVVHTVKGPATNAATNQTVACFHAIFHATAQINQAESEGLADRRKLKTAYAVFLRIRELVSVLVSVADPAAPDSLLHPQLELAAEVGIGQVTRFKHRHPVQS